MSRKTIIVKTQREADEEKGWGILFFLIGLILCFLIPGILLPMLLNLDGDSNIGGIVGIVAFITALVFSIFSKRARALITLLAYLTFIGGILYTFFVMISN